MKKHITIFIQITVLTSMFYGLNFAQNNKDSIQQQSLNKKDIDLKIALAKKKISIGEKIELKISLKNNFSKTVALLFMSYDFFAGYQVEITDSRGEIIQPLNDPQENRGIGKRRERQVNATTEDNRILILSDFYQLLSEKYSITVSQKVNNTEKIESVFIKSNTIEIIVEQTSLISENFAI